jgi:hypothetical protein
MASAKDFLSFRLRKCESAKIVRCHGEHYRRVNKRRRLRRLQDASTHDARQGRSCWKNRQRRFRPSPYLAHSMRQPGHVGWVTRPSGWRPLLSLLSAGRNASYFPALGMRASGPLRNARATPASTASFGGRGIPATPALNSSPRKAPLRRRAAVRGAREMSGAYRTFFILVPRGVPILASDARIELALHLARAF